MSERDKNLNAQTVHLISKAKSGKAEAFDALYKLYESRLKKAVKKEMGPKVRAKMESVDILQSVWKDCLGKLDNYEYQGADSFFRWMLLRVIHKIQDKGRAIESGKRDIGKEQPLAVTGTPARGAALPPAPNPSPSQVAMNNESIDRLMHLLDHLPDSQRKVLVFKMRDSMDFDEIAKKIGKTEGAARQLYIRAVNKLGKIMKEESKVDNQ